MKIPIYQVDAFTSHVFGGNPAAVCVLKKWLPTEVMQQIAIENNLAETAFVTPQGSHLGLRWFTPETEIDLCGHATLATAHVLYKHLKYKAPKIVFESMSGILEVTQQGKMLTLNFPSRPAEPAALPKAIQKALSTQPTATLKAPRDYMLVYDSEEAVRNLVVNPTLLGKFPMDKGGVIVTARGNEADFVSRFFTPNASVFEDPVTGSAHCTLIPYWSAYLNKPELYALQVSDRLGTLMCKDMGERVHISGEAKTYLKGEIKINR